MGQMTWRVPDVLLERVRRQARERGRSLNEHVTAVLDAATDPDLAGDEADRLRARLSAAGLLVPERADQRRPEPDREAVARARVAAGRGTPLSALVIHGRE